MIKRPVHARVEQVLLKNDKQRGLPFAPGKKLAVIGTDVDSIISIMDSIIVISFLSIISIMGSIIVMSFLWKRQGSNEYLTPPKLLD